MLRLALTAILLVTLMRPALAAPGDITTIAGSPGRGNPLTLQQSAQALFGVGSKIYVADGTSRVVRVIDTSTDFEDLVAGVAIPGLPVSGAATAALAASLPANLSAVALDANGNTFIGDETSFRVRRVDALTGLMSFVIGTGASGSSGNGCLDCSRGSAESAVSLSTPLDVSISRTTTTV